MLHGYAWHVTYPRRPEQAFVTTDEVHVLKELANSVQARWSVKATLIRFHGDTALPVDTTAFDLEKRIYEPLRKFFKVTRDCIWT